MEAYLSAIVAALFGVNIALIAWTFQKMQVALIALQLTMNELSTKVAVIQAIQSERAAFIQEMRSIADKSGLG